MQRAHKHIDQEFVTMTKMVGIYCAGQHRVSGRDLCDSCQEFLDYAQRRLDKCLYGEDKPTCANCPVHCYKPAQRAQAKDIMRYAGPRMLLRHPFMTIAHQLDGLRKARHPRELTREKRLQSRSER